MTTATIDRATLLRANIQAAEIELRELETSAAMQSRIDIANNQLEQMRTNVKSQKALIATLEKKIQDQIIAVFDAFRQRHERQRQAPGASDIEGARMTTLATDQLGTFIMGKYRAIDAYEAGKKALETFEAAQPKIPAAAKKTAA